MSIRFESSSVEEAKSLDAVERMELSEQDEKLFLTCLLILLLAFENASCTIKSTVEVVHQPRKRSVSPFRFIDLSAANMNYDGAKSFMTPTLSAPLSRHQASQQKVE